MCPTRFYFLCCQHCPPCICQTCTWHCTTSPRERSACTSRMAPPRVRCESDITTDRHLTDDTTRCDAGWSTHGLRPAVRLHQCELCAYGDQTGRRSEIKLPAWPACRIKHAAVDRTGGIYAMHWHLSSVSGAFISSRGSYYSTSLYCCGAVARRGTGTVYCYIYTYT